MKTTTNHLIRHIEKDPTYGRGSWVFSPFEAETQACLRQADDSMQRIIFSFRKEFSQVWRALTSLSQFVSRSFLLELVAFTMSDTASSPIHVSFSDEKKEELLVQQPSASSVV